MASSASMTSRQRLLAALSRQTPDRLPVTVHQWQPYHLTQYMGGCDQIEAFRRVGLDASVLVGNLQSLQDSPDWRVEHRETAENTGESVTHTRVHTPSGELTMVSKSNDYTSYVVEHLIKDQAQAEWFLKHAPAFTVDASAVRRARERLGDDGIVRGFVPGFHQPGPWQDFCGLVGTQEAIFWALDDADFVHHFLDGLTERKTRCIRAQMSGLELDLVENGGGSASSTVISPAMFDEFCVPYDLQIHEALHEVGLLATYHTCGGMKAILDHIPSNGADASETLSPPDVGGDIGSEADRHLVRERLGSRVALIGGINQAMLEQPNSDELEQAIAEQVRSCFETFGRDGGYICSASDHFFHAPPENLSALARAAHQCCYA